MRKPSARVLANTVDWYQATTAESGAGYQPSYPTTPTRKGIPCSVQVTNRSLSDDIGRVTVVSVYDVIFDRDWGINVRDKLIWVDTMGSARTLYVESEVDNAGRGAAFTVECVEKY